MLQDFPAELAVVRVKTKPAELEGFYSEPSKLGKVRTQLPANASGIAGPVLTVLAAVAVAVAILLVTSWRATPADALSRTATIPMRSNIVLPAEPIPLSAEPVLPAAPVNLIELIEATRTALVELPPLSTRADRKAAIAPSAATPVQPPVAVAPEPAERSQVAQVAQVAQVPQVAPVVAVANVETAPTAPRRAVEFLADTPQVNIVPVRTIAVVDETPAIQDVIRRYESAYERLDAAAAKQIWPSLDERALASAFAGLASQTLTLQPCRVDVTNRSAVASCNGYATYVGRVGNKAGQIQRRTWKFQLLKSPDGWQIGSVQSN
jgi:hypothetical protein